MYSTASPPPKKEGAKSITPSESKGGKPPTVWQRLSVFYQIIPVGATSEQKSGRISCRFLRREAPLRRGYFKSVPQAHRNYSLFTFHYSFFHPKLRKGEKPRHTPSVPGIARESPPARGATIQRRGVCRGGRAFPGRPAGPVPRDRAHIPSVCRQRPGGCPGPPVPPLPGTVPSVLGPSCRGWLFPPGCRPASG